MATGMTVWSYRSPVAADDLNLNFTLLSLRILALGGQNLSGTLKVWKVGEDPASTDLNNNFALLEAQIAALEAGQGSGSGGGGSGQVPVFSFDQIGGTTVTFDQTMNTVTFDRTA